MNSIHESTKSTAGHTHHETMRHYGGVLKMIFAIEPQVIGYPGKIDRNTWYSMAPCLESLTKIDRYGRPLPHLAAKWNIDKDKNTITIFLRKNVTFHDGTDFNAEAAKFNLDEVRIFRPQSLPSLELITSIEVIDTYTIKIHVSRFSNTILADMSTCAGLMTSPTSIHKNGEPWARDHAVGTGPFELEAFERGNFLRFRRFKGYWQENKPYLDGIEVRNIKDGNEAAAAFLEGEAHLYQFFASKYAKNASLIESKGYEVKRLECGLVGLLPDSLNPDSPFADIKVREAVEYALDRPAIVKKAGYGFWVPLEQCVPAGHMAHNAQIKGRLYHPDKARQLLADAGYPNGFHVKVPIEGKSITNEEVLEVNAYLEKVGIHIEPEYLTPPEYSKMKKEGWKNGFTLTTIIPIHGNVARHFEREIQPDYSTYRSMKRPERWEEILINATFTDDLEEHKKHVQELSKVVFDEAMFVPLLMTHVVAAKQPGVHDDGNCLVSKMHWDPENAWLSR